MNQSIQPALRRTAVFAAAVLALLAAFATAARADNYVALGDSYAAGPLIPNQIGPPLGCLRSSNNYAHLAGRASASRCAT